jgi:hypothetical protein
VIYVTGDTHGELDISKLSAKRWPEGITLTKNDYLIIAGDFGLLWDNVPSKKELYWTEWLTNKPWTTLFVDGNHENHVRLQALPREEKFGGIVGKVNDSIYHLRRGEIYVIDNNKIFTFGGAYSIDKPNRIQGISWWPEEMPSYAETSYALEKLYEHQYSVDYIIAHNCPTTIAEVYIRFRGMGLEGKRDTAASFLEHAVSTTEFKKFYFGHWHDNWQYGKYRMLYEDIVKLGE